MCSATAYKAIWSHASHSHLASFNKRMKKPFRTNNSLWKLMPVSFCLTPYNCIVASDHLTDCSELQYTTTKNEISELLTIMGLSACTRSKGKVKSHHIKQPACGPLNSWDISEYARHIGSYNGFPKRVKRKKHTATTGHWGCTSLNNLVRECVDNIWVCLGRGHKILWTLPTPSSSSTFIGSGTGTNNQVMCELSARYRRQK